VGVIPFKACRVWFYLDERDRNVVRAWLDESDASGVDRIVNESLERLRKEFQNEDSRYVYADSVVNAFISAQIKALREDRKLNQQELAELMGTKQSGISRLERSDYSVWKVGTLRKLARAFGVRLRISFEEFGTLPPEIGDFTEKRLCPRNFDNDPVFKEGWSRGRIKRRRSG